MVLDDMSELPDGVDMNSFELSTTFPKKTYGNDEAALKVTLKEAELVPQGVLFVAWS